MNPLTRLKLILGVEDQDKLLKEIINMTTERLLLYTKLEYLPDDLEWLLIELSVQRFNRIGSEGFQSESVDGNNTNYGSAESFLGEYKAFLDNYIKENTANKGWWLL